MRAKLYRYVLTEVAHAGSSPVLSAPNFKIESMKENEKSEKEVAKHRVCEYEKATLKMKDQGIECVCSSFTYQKNSLFIEKVNGTVETARFRIFVTWDCDGRASVQGARAEEYDLKLID